MNKQSRFELFLYAALAVLVLSLSAAYLYSFPTPDSAMFRGDESLLAAGARTQIATGRMLIPFAVGSPQSTTPGFLVSCEWLFAVIYGLPQLLLSHGLSAVAISRTISYLLAIGSVLLLLRFGKYIHIRRTNLFFAAVVLITTPSFVFSSHCGRYDSIIGFTVLLVFALLLYSGSKQSNLENRLHPFLFGVLAACATFLIAGHLVALLPLPLLYASWRLRILRSPRQYATASAGFICVLIALLAQFYLANGELTLFGPTHFANQYYSVLDVLPIHHPISRSAQFRIVAFKFEYLWLHGRIFLAIIPALLLARVALRNKLSRISQIAIELLAVYLFASYYLQSTLPYYVYYFLPYSAFVFALVLNDLAQSQWLSWPRMAIAVSLTAIAVNWIGTVSPVSKQITIENRRAVTNALHRIPKIAGEKPLVLATFPALYLALQDTNIRVMSESFLVYPEDSLTPLAKLRKLGVRYILDYGHPLTASYASALPQIGHVSWEASGTLLDDNLNFFYHVPLLIDTLKLYTLPRTTSPPM